MSHSHFLVACVFLAFADEAALCIARAERTLEAGNYLPF